jgi:hypothetical protein
MLEQKFANFLAGHKSPLELKRCISWLYVFYFCSRGALLALTFNIANFALLAVLEMI